MTLPDWRPAIEAITPVDCRWRLAWGDLRGTLKLQFDFGLLPTTNGALEFFMTEVFRRAFAPLVSRSATVTLCSVSALKLGGPIFAFAPFALRGDVIGDPRGDNKSGVYVAHLGGSGSQSTRRFYVPFMPAYFSDFGVLSDLAIGLGVTMCRGLMLGADGDVGGVGPRLIAWRPPQGALRWRDQRDAQFAIVQQCLALTFIDRTPDEF